MEYGWRRIRRLTQWFCAAKREVYYEGTLWGGFLSRRTRMLPVRKSDGPGKEVPPERARTNQRKRNGTLAAECHRKTRKPASTKWNGIFLPLVKVLMSSFGHASEMPRGKTQWRRSLSPRLR